MKILIACDKMCDLARDIAREQHLCQKVVQWGVFDDCFPNLMIQDADEIRGADVYFLASFDLPQDIFQQLGVIYALPHYGAKSLTVFLPFFPTATMERVDVKGQVATAKTLMRMLNAIPHCHKGGPARLVVYDIHSLAVQHFHGDGIIVDLRSAIPMFLGELKRWCEPEDCVFVFPDDGARKRFHTYFECRPTVTCTKVRDDSAHVKVTVKDGVELVRGKHAIIIDDMVRGGATILQCKDALIDAAAQQVSAFVTHGVFTTTTWFMDPWDVQSQKFSSLSNFWFTDSCRIARFLGQQKYLASLKLISLSKLIGSEISDIEELYGGTANESL